MFGGFERYFQIARCFRDEDLRADRQPEFTQLDLEMSFVAEDDVIELIEGVMSSVFATGDFEVAAPPWPRMAYAEAMLRFGSDRPDTRFGLEIARRVRARARLASSRSSSRCSTAAASCARSTPGRGSGAVAQRAGRPQRRRAPARRQGRGADPGGGRAARGARTWRSSSAPTQAARRERGARAPTRATCCCSSPTGTSVAPAAIGALRLHLGERFGLDPAGPPRRTVGRRLPDVRLQREREALGSAAPPVHRAGAPARRRAAVLRGSRGADVARLRPRRRRLGARRRLDPYPRSRAAGARCSRRSASAPRRRRHASASCSTPCATGRRRSAASRWGSTASWRSCWGRSRSAT